MAGTDRSQPNSIAERAVNAGASLGTPASRARLQGQSVPLTTASVAADRPRTAALTQSQLLEQALTGKPVPSTAPAPNLPVANLPTTAREACGKRVFLAMVLCMEQRCEEPRYRSGTECVKILENKRAQENH